MTLRFAAWQDSFDIWRSAAYFAGMEGAFDPLRYFDELMAADVPEKKARVQAEAMRSAFASYDAGRQKELITRSDTRDFATRDDIQAVKEDVRDAALK